jgi:hypothetical protein
MPAVMPLRYLATLTAHHFMAFLRRCDVNGCAAEIIDFRPTTSPQAVLGIALRTVPGADQQQGSSWMHAYDIVQPGGGRR